MPLIERLRKRPDELKRGFRPEAACERYLADRYRHGQCPCRGCGETQGYYLAERKSWECKGCKRQVGLRSGTVMARSPLPLCTWFEAIRWLLWQPTIATAALAEKHPITRPTTLRNLAHKIRTAVAAENATELLAGLNDYFPDPTLT